MPPNYCLLRHWTRERLGISFAYSLLALLLVFAGTPVTLGQDIGSLERTSKDIQTKMAKVYGAGKIGGLESYQSGCFISDQGHVLTAWSTVLDVDSTLVVTSDGKRWDGKLVGMDPQTELAILKIDGDGFPYFSLDQPAPVEEGTLVLGVSNLFGIATGNEDHSVQRGVVMAISNLTAHRGRMQSPYTGTILVIDVISNNPGAMGGALVNLEGELVGILGKELRDDATGNWLNFALPVSVVAESAKSILKGDTAISANRRTELAAVENPHRLQDLGLALVPNVLSKTPAYINQVKPESPASKAGLKTNDLILNINGKRVDSRKNVEQFLSTINRADSFRLLIQRGSELLNIEIQP